MRLTLGLGPARWPRRATVAAAIVGAGAWSPGPAAAVAPIVALATVRHPIPGIRSSAAAIFVVGATAAVIAVAPTVVAAVAVAATAAAALAARRRTAVHASPHFTSFQWGDSDGSSVESHIYWISPTGRRGGLLPPPPARAPDAYSAAPVRGREGRVVPLRGVQGKARSPVTHCSQQRRPGRVPGFTGAYHHRQYTAPLCLGVRGPA